MTTTYSRTRATLRIIESQSGTVPPATMFANATAAGIDPSTVEVITATTDEQKAAILAASPPTPAETANAAETAGQAALLADALANPTMQTLAAATPAQIDAWINANITNLASALPLLKLLTKLAARYLRSLTHPT